jgi:hypothetical protein
MAIWYWVAAAPANFATISWATSSGGSPTGQPATGDTAIFDSHSSQTCTLAAAVSLASFDCHGGTGDFVGTFSHGAFTLTITGTTLTAFRLSPGMTYTTTSGASVVAFSNTSGIAGITSAGNNLAGVSMTGVGGTTQQQDNLNITAQANSNITLVSGTWDCNNGVGCTLSIGIWSSNNSNTRAFICAGTVTVGGNVGANQSPINFAGAGLTFTLNAANIVVVGPSAPTNNWTFTLPSIAIWNSFTFNANTYGIFASVAFPAVVTFANFTINSGFMVTSSTNNISITITNPFNWVGTQTNPVGFFTINPGPPVIHCPGGACTATWAVLNCSAVGGATFTATNSFAQGGTSGWAITPPLPQAAATQLATAVWQDLLNANDFTTPGSVGALMKAMTNLQFTVPVIGRGTVGPGSTTTSITTSAFSIAPSTSIGNQFVGRGIIFDPNTTTVALRGQAARITGTSAATNPTFTVSALTAAPIPGDTFSVT